MAEAVVSMVVERMGSIIEQRIGEEVNLVRGFDSKIVNLSQELKTIRLVLDDAEKKGLVETGDKAVRNWLKKLENASYELDDVLDEWYTALRMFQIQQDQKSKVCNYTSFISCSSFQKLAVRHDIAEKLQRVKQKIDSILAEKDRYGFETTTATPHSHDWRVQSTPFVDMAGIYGRDIERDDLVRRLISAMTQAGDQTNHPQILSVVGVGGIGKTTLAQLVYNDSQVSEYFVLRIWICVSDPFDEARVAKHIIENVTKKSPPDSNQLGFLLGCLKECISGKKFLLVMDDVWTEDFSKWEPLLICLKNGSIGSKVLVTTRNEMVAKMTGTFNDGIYRLGVLSDENCWLLLQCVALFGRDEGEWENFEGIGRNIANKCKGLPLAAKVLGSLLRLKNSLEEWEDVYNSEIWELEGPKDNIFPHLYLSYNELSPSLKRCFSYCAVFPKDTRIDVEEVIEHWMAMGYLGSDESGAGDMELRGREYFDNLAARSLFQEFEKGEIHGQIKYCKMHDIVLDFALSLRKNGDEEVEIKKTSTCETCSPLLVSRAKEYRSIYFDNKETHWPCCSCVANLRVVSIKKRDFHEKQRIGHEIERFIHLRWLDLSFNNLAGKDMETICRLYNLQTLLLPNCHLKEIPREIGNLIHLRHLNLGDNIFLKELPREIGNLIQLRHLNLSDNTSLKELPREIGNLIHLRHLNLKSNRSIKELPREIGNLIHLRHLDLSLNESLKELPREIGNLIHLRHLDLWGNKSLKELPMEIGNLIHLRHLNLSGNNSLDELPREIGNLIHLRHLNLSRNTSLKELPESICNLQGLQRLNINYCTSIRRLPQGFHKLVNLKHLHNEDCKSLELEGVAQLTSLRTLNQFNAGSGRGKLGWLKNLNRLSCSLTLFVHLSGSENIVEDAREGELKKKDCIQEMDIRFYGRLDRDREWVSLLEALEPHPNLVKLQIYSFGGSKLPSWWMVSPLNHLKFIRLQYFSELLSLPPLGRLPCLEEIVIFGIYKLQVVGQEFLGTTTQGSNSSCIAFPKLKRLTFEFCDDWREWEDITTIQKAAPDSVSSVMHCLTELAISSCNRLRALPHRLLGCSSLEKLDISGSTQLKISYGNRENSAWKSISDVCPRLQPSL